MESIAENVRRILSELPPGVHLVAAAKTRTPAEVRAAVDAGVRIIGCNYVQEAESMRAALKEWEASLPQALSWHGIGHIQSNKAARAAALFDLIETVDSLRLASALDRHAAGAGKVLPVLIEVNSAREANKNGVFPEDVESLVRDVAQLRCLRVEGLMTMGPLTDDVENLRPFFRLTRRLFDDLAALRLPGVAMRFLSMGMSDSYRVAVEEGANIVRIGTALFGRRRSGGG